MRIRLLKESLSSQEIKEIAMRIKDEEGSIFAQKKGRVLIRAYKGRRGETIETYTSGGDLETTNSVKDNDSYVVTKADQNGKAIEDEYGHTNTWIMGGDTFRKSYKVLKRLSSGEMICQAIPDRREFVQVPYDVEFDSPWGGTETVRKGGYLNIQNPNKIYGVSQRDFNDTYEIVI